jgi:hypothetical protein
MHASSFTCMRDHVQKCILNLILSVCYRYESPTQHSCYSCLIFISGLSLPRRPTQHTGDWWPERTVPLRLVLHTYTVTSFLTTNCLLQWSASYCLLSSAFYSHLSLADGLCLFLWRKFLCIAICPKRSPVLYWFQRSERCANILNIASSNPSVAVN